ncbi:homoserine kinase [Jiangella alkaliphila]|uniref:Homoserine kinase n=1 Tax=Jiangella alkaliphila TaxID=419479 RepID=A0A1H2JK31_9ACTN|nr:homoserine kinase [Jiangella alkaliphila]SDU56839.1 homoserine kinase [Jiangella alkaliphila]
MSPATVRVRTPATSANLGPGFDAFGLALSLHDEIEVTARFGGPAAPVEVTVDGEGAGSVPLDERHLVVRSLRAAFAELGEQPSALRLHCRNALPHGRGLGSSAGAIVGGVVAARALTGVTAHDDALALADRLEGHPDNVAACLYGGLTVAWRDDAGAARATRIDVHPDVAPIVCVPSFEVSTEKARGLLPGTVPHADAAANAGRAALLVHALGRRPDLLLDATADRLHQHYREPAMPETFELVTALRADGLAAVVSGAGPTVLVLGTGDDAGRVSALAGGWYVRALQVDTRGADVEYATP